MAFAIKNGFEKQFCSGNEQITKGDKIALIVDAIAIITFVTFATLAITQTIILQPVVSVILVGGSAVLLVLDIISMLNKHFVKKQILANKPHEAPAKGAKKSFKEKCIEAIEEAIQKNKECTGIELSWAKDEGVDINDHPLNQYMNPERWQITTQTIKVIYNQLQAHFNKKHGVNLSFLGLDGGSQVMITYPMASEKVPSS